MRYLIVALALLAVGGCSTKNTPEDFFKVERGMTPNQVKQILGEPIRKSKVLSRYVYDINGRTVTIGFDNTDDFTVEWIALDDNTDEVEEMFGENEDAHNDNNSPNKAQF